MKQSRIAILIFLSVVFFTMGFQCNNEEIPNPKPIYEFVEKLTLTPYKKIYAINDTIWIQFQTTDKTLYDKLTNRRIAIDTTFLQLRFRLRRCYPIVNGVTFFSKVKIDGHVQDTSFTSSYFTNNTLRFTTGCTDSNYYFKIGIIPEMRGIYSISLTGSLSPCPEKVKFIPTTLSFTFDLANCNKEVWLSIPPQSRGGELGFTDVNIDKKKLFVFKVE